MATGNMLLGQARGSVGDLTFYRRDGKQVTRAKVSQVSNPKSSLQMIQRMIFATIAAAYSRTKSITDHSFEGVQYGAKSQAKFMAINLERLRAFYPRFNDPNVKLNETMAFAARGNAADSGVGLIISTGSLPTPKVTTNASGQVLGFGGESGDNPTIARFLQNFGAEPGDQITVVALVDINGVRVFKKSRYVVKADASAQELAEQYSGAAVAAAFDTTKTEVGDITLDAVGASGYEVMSQAGNTVIGAAVILSRQDESGKWMRSPAVLLNYLDEAPEFAADYALNTWVNTGTEIDAASEKYLNNADL